MDIPFEYKTFEYDALPSSTSIRLLWPIKRLQDPEQRSINGVPLMEFLLEPSEPDRCPLYHALSYTWGNPKEALTGSSDEYSVQHRHVIAVNGRLFYVGKNLYEALYRIQERIVAPNNIDDRFGQPLWIDAICINQDDIPERNNQVVMMSQIYGSAHCVLAWLGEEDDTTQVACNFLSSELASPESYTKSFRRWSAYHRGESLDLDEKSDDIVMSVRELLAIKSLLTRTWFSRTWVIQEVSLAKQIDMMCGPFQFSWVKLFFLLFGRFGDIRASRFLGYGGPAIKFERAVPGTEVLSLFDIRIRTRPDCREAKSRREWLLEQATSHSLYQQKLSLPALIVLTWNFAVSDPRDRIFALLGISQPLKGLWADYSKSVTEVFTDMAKILIQAEGDDSVQNWTQTVMDDLEPLESLSFVQPPSCFLFQSSTISLNKPKHDRPTTLPSWVPMFNLQLVSWRIYNKKYNASRDRQATFYPSQPEILKLDGLVVDTVVELEEPPLMTFYERLIDDNAIEKWLGIVSRISVVYPTGESRVEALWRTIVQEKQDYEKSEASKAFFKVILLECMVEHRRRSSSDRHLSLCQVLEGLRRGDSTNLLPSALDVITSNQGLNDKSEDGFRRFLDLPEQEFRFGMFNYLTERCLLRTEGGYLGISSKEAKPKDCVVLLAGGRTPYILRPIGVNEFMFIGEAYIHGMMFGESLRGQERDFNTIKIK
ncbi:Heterokaryon incompatibility protein 6, OR allele [Fusarium oxysporum f. sp. cubense race 1]|uniref:Heterokaryon incompatibility protein 6, OR allele n=1 Tax=Fusarium oxysporum f. sp. cubense (strain race 1) TaxID=1229664 RepID=N4UGZ6_FUSC1|nr:Heterokaryon incompatibility protein 6, OR allele [Fusarium oxysporum f. sp. cubense race 1]